MELVVYAPPEVLISHLDVLDHLRSEHPLRAVILRESEIEAFEAVRQRGLEAWWLAPGLWGNVKPPPERQAEFPEVPAWTEDLPEALSLGGRCIVLRSPSCPLSWLPIMLVWQRRWEVRASTVLTCATIIPPTLRSCGAAFALVAGPV